MRKKYILIPERISVKTLILALFTLALNLSQAFAQCSNNGKILREYWSNIPGNNINNIPFNTPPSEVGYLTSFKGPVDAADNYGSRIRGYICAPSTGHYTFWIAGDDHCELWLSTDANPGNKVKIAYVEGWTSPEQWDKYPTQTSTSITLQANQKYYIEVLQKEGVGGDNIAVGWQLPNGNLERPIAGNRLSPFVMPHIEAEDLVDPSYERPIVLNNAGASGGKLVGFNWQGSFLSIKDFMATGDGQYVLTIRYGDVDEPQRKSLYINDAFVSKFLLPSTLNFGETQQLIQLTPGTLNSITFKAEYDGDGNGGNYDYFRLDLASATVPTQAVVNDSTDTFGWSYIPGYSDVSFYEYSTNNGASWSPAVANPQPVGNNVYAYGAVKVRLKADPASGRPAGYPLSANGAYSIKNATPPVTPGITLWQIGKNDNSSNEFSSFSSTNPDSVVVPSNWNSTNDWSYVSKGLKGDINKALNLTYTLSSIPEYGVELNFRILDAANITPQLAVFSNGTFAGLIQIAGLNGNGLDKKFKEIYRLYIPKELLKIGTNDLNLVFERGIYANSSGDSYHWWEWDYLKLETLGGEANEPIHGRYIHLGNNFPGGFNGARQVFLLGKWTGMAYSGNWMRGGPDVTAAKNDSDIAYLETLRQLNILPMPLVFPGSIVRSGEVMGGTISSSVRNQYRDYLKNYGSLLGAVETENEPGLFNSSQVGVEALTKMAQDEKATYAPHIKVVSPGWAYWPTNGTPSGWERDPAMRRSIENYADLTNGHSYGTSGTGGRGGALVETLLTYSDHSGDGFPKEMVMSEVGAADEHTDPAHLGTAPYKHAAIFDREIRGDIGYASHIMYHMSFFNETSYTMFNPNVDQNKLNPEDAQVWKGNHEGEESRLKTYRRLTLAYATHGAPLSYEYINKSELAGKKAYFRGVNTAALGKLSTGAESDKVLLNLINFDTATLTINVKVQMPGGGTYVGERVGSGDTYAQASTPVTLANNSGYVELNETLKAGESIQFILVAQETSAPSAPQNLTANAKSFKEVALKWDAATDNVAVAGYRIYRNGTVLNVVPRAVTSFTDFKVTENTGYTYYVVAFDDAGNISEHSNEVTVATPSMPVTPGGPKFEAEDLTFDRGGSDGQGVRILDFAVASGGKEVGYNWSSTSVKIMGFTPVQNDYILTVAYRNNVDYERSIYVNQELDIAKFKSTIKLPNTNDSISEEKFNIKLVPGTKNIIEIKSDWPQNQGGNYDYFKLEPGVYQVEPKWRTVAHSHPAITYSPNFTQNNNQHETTTVGNYAELTIKGMGIRWQSNVSSNMGSAEVYIDGSLKSSINVPEAALEGANRIVYEITGLPEGLHTIRIVNKENKLIGISNFQFLGFIGEPAFPGPDLIVTNLSWSPSDPQPDGPISFSATIKNVGTRSTNDTLISAAFFIDNQLKVWSDNQRAVLQPGDSITVTANGGPAGLGTWAADTAGVYQVRAHVNDTERVRNEMDKENNTLTKLLTVGGSSPAPFSVIKEAEDATLAGVLISNIHTGYSGSGFGDYINASNDYIEWRVTVPQSGIYDLEFRYALGTAVNRNLRLVVNQTVVNPNLPFVTTGSWTAWSRQQLSTQLVEGENTIRIVAIGSSGPNIDHLKISRASSSSSSRGSFENEENDRGQMLTIYPNPASTEFTLLYSSSETDNIRFELSDMSNRVQVTKDLKVQKGINQVRIDVSSLRKGLYLIRINGKHNRIIRKILVE